MTSPLGKIAVAELEDLIIDGVDDERFHAMCCEVLHDNRFAVCPGGSSHHHNYRGGLAQHVWEVTMLVREMSNRENIELLTVAAIFHDYYKIYEYDFAEDGTIVNLPYRKLIGHIVGGFQFFTEQAHIYGLDAVTTQRIQHCLLSHHGRLEWRSPVEPQTKEAHILHSADMISAQGKFSIFNDERATA